MAHLIEPKQIDVPTLDGDVCTFVIGKFPYVLARDIVRRKQEYIDNPDKVAAWALDKSILLDALKYCERENDVSNPIPLSSLRAINDNVPDYICLDGIINSMWDYSFSFLKDYKSPNYAKFKSDGAKVISYKNIDAIEGVLITEKVATLYELKSVYSFEEALLQFEAVMVNRSNEYYAAEFANKKAKGGR